jgi:hypothetical protein
MDSIGGEREFYNGVRGRVEAWLRPFVVRDNDSSASQRTEWHVWSIY